MLTNDRETNEDTKEEYLPESEENSTTESLAFELVKQLQNEISELKDRVLRSSAEVENTRKRYENMVREAHDYANMNFAKDLMGAMDNLYRALEHKPKTEDQEVQNFAYGVELINSELQNTFSKYGIVRILPQVGDKFDYNIHQAVSQIPTNDFEPGMIVNVMQAGYSLKDRLMRPAMVIVSIAKGE